MNLSVIVPIYNEIEQLPVLFDMLAAQRDICLELIVVDGGSDDGSPELVSSQASGYRWPLILLQSSKGRARQLNAGAASASYDHLLFLHADSLLEDDTALAKALEAVAVACATASNERIAGHFRLRFRRSNDDASFGFYFWESKARLDRPECTHGDQGMLLSRAFFAEVGPFEDDVPIAEDTRLAERVREYGSWLLLPVDIWTSARRFEVEGLRARQTLNALIMNFAAIGWDDFFAAAAAVYREQAALTRLELSPFFDLIDRLNRAAPWRQRLLRWYRTGCYVRPNAWQLAFYIDAKRGFRTGVPPGELPLPILKVHDRWFELLTDNLFGRLVAMCGTWIWFRLTVWQYRLRGG